MKVKPRERDLKTGGNVYEGNQTKLKPKQEDKKLSTCSVERICDVKEGRIKRVCVCLSLSLATNTTTKNQTKQKHENQTKTLKKNFVRKLESRPIPWIASEPMPKPLRMHQICEKNRSSKTATLHCVCVSLSTASFPPSPRLTQPLWARHTCH